jgi:signal transduction histidine kinase
VKQRTARIISRTLLVIGIAAPLLTLPMALAVNRAHPDFINPITMTFDLIALVWLAAGVVIVSRAPRNWAGWIFCFIGFTLCLVTAAQAYAVYALLLHPGELPFVGLAAWVNEYSYYAIILVPLLFLLFPDGKVPSPRWRWALIGLLGAPIITFLSYVLRPETYNNLRDFGIAYENPFGVPAFEKVAGVLIEVSAIVILISAFSTVFAVRQRFKRSRGEERQQMRWLAAVAATAGILFVAMWVVMIGGSSLPTTSFPVFPAIQLLLVLVVAFGIPAAYLVAILKYGLYDLDMIISKTLLYGSLAVFITVVYVVVVVGVGGLVGASSDNLALSIGATAIIAIAFQTARERLQKVANRIIYGKRATPYEVLASFSGLVAHSLSVDEVLPEIAEVVGTGVGAEAAVVLVSLPDGTERTERWGAASEGDATTIIPVSYQDRQIGSISVEKSANDPLTPSEASLLEDLASHAGLAMHNVRLTEELGAKVAELAVQSEQLRVSRQRLVTARDAQRKGLERDIHEGPEHQLIEIRGRLESLDELADDAAMTAELESLTEQANATLEGLRDLARGIFPPLLADKGIVAAVQAHIRKVGAHAQIEADPAITGARFDDAVEACVYFCCLQALQNVIRHAGNALATVRLSTDADSLTFEIHDDGPGFEVRGVSRGMGIDIMQDRIDALDGDLSIESSPGNGTRVIGRISLTLAGVPS